jgi:hypothetical protein
VRPIYPRGHEPYGGGLRRAISRYCSTPFEVLKLSGLLTRILLELTLISDEGVYFHGCEPATRKGGSRAVWVVPSLKLLPQKKVSFYSCSAAKSNLNGRALAFTFKPKVLWTVCDLGPTSADRLVQPAGGALRSIMMVHGPCAGLRAVKTGLLC